ncbi:uncharacterized protein LOC9644798 isoform X2 [Selaginella moellendorffii]|uniref:uncharacterized protein LOC9644798 isoform X2 n=1 Tax=Selaginella moellendorffii TaxID=88036 RepID=UPI000D1C2D4B|nr:uncharacterized protein LOC9644798 isoform X2 [Selaginella moellendorffii]|eukprot:XP_024545389.1 uncharacterized protein LOC9644798 isoform X2 [Selaginella moellendorffii]
MAAGPVPRVRLADLVPSDGLASDCYKQAAVLLFQSLQKYSFAVIQLSASDGTLLRCVLDSARMFFHQRPPPGPETIHTEDSQNWHRTAGYYSDPHFAKEVFDYRPGTPDSTAELPPTGLPELFVTLGTASRHILEAIAWVLELRSFSFTEFLDNIPLKNGEVSSSVLSVSCHGRPGLQHPGAMDLAPIYDGHDQNADKGLVTLMKSDKHGLEIRDMHGRWHLADGGLGPQDVVLFCGLSLYQATGGHVTPAFFRTEAGSSSSHMHLYGRCSTAFKLMPKATGLLHCLTTSGGVAGSSPFQQSVTVHDFMQRSHSIDQLIGMRQAFSFPSQQEGPMKPLKRRKQVSRGKPLAPSKRLRLEAQRVLKERVQEIAEGKNLKIRFCNLKDCEENHLTTLDSPCSSLREELGWPRGVPLVHPHDLPNKAKQAFLEAYEPGWTASQDVELGLIEAGHLHCKLRALVFVLRKARVNFSRVLRFGRTSLWFCLMDQFLLTWFSTQRNSDKRGLTFINDHGRF